MLSYDPTYMNYLAPIQYLISGFIYEYDISQANINILSAKGILTDAQYETLKGLPKIERQIYVGYLQKNEKIAKALQDGLAYYRKEFIEKNNISNAELLSVKNDAFFLINKIPNVTKFGKVEFRRKNIFTSFFKLGNLEVYHYFDRMNEDHIIDVKGINDETLLLHQDYMLSFLCEIFESLSTEPLEITSNKILDFYKAYISKTLPIGYYREFNADSKFLFRVTPVQNFKFDNISDKEFPYIDISFNLNVIRDLYSIISTEYFKRVK